LDLKAFISSNAFYYPAFFYKQLELTRFVFALISDALKSRSEVDTTGGKPIMFDNALELYFFLVVRGLGNFYEIKKPQDARQLGDVRRDPPSLVSRRLISFFSSRPCRWQASNALLMQQACRTSKYEQFTSLTHVLRPPRRQLYRLPLEPGA